MQISAEKNAGDAIIETPLKIRSMRHFGRMA